MFNIDTQHHNTIEITKPEKKHNMSPLINNSLNFSVGLSGFHNMELSEESHIVNTGGWLHMTLIKCWGR